MAGIFGSERGLLPPVDLAVSGVQLSRASLDSQQSVDRHALARRVVRELRARQDVVWRNPRLAASVDLVTRLQLPSAPQGLSFPLLLPGFSGQPQGPFQLCADSSQCYPPIVVHWPFPVVSQAERSCPFSLSCLRTWEGMDTFLHLLETHTVDCLQLLGKFLDFTFYVCSEVVRNCDDFLEIEMTFSFKF